jgi:site-specific DNA-methyltransferase (adenine-specific)
MNTQAAFTLRGRNPDVLTCIANLSNDEVFTPPEFASRMLDTLADTWAAENGGANIWADKTVKFLDPFTKSGVFLREITIRLTKGLADEIPDLEERVNHILTKQVYGIAITQITSLLARRSVYCSKHANGEHSIAKSFANTSGNIWFERTKHLWKDGRCRYCGAPQEIFDRKDRFETHAYAFIHTDNIKTRLAEIFGGNMQFDVIVGNPPYQMTGAAGGGVDSSIYHLFIDQAKRLEPRYVIMVIPSRWMAGGRGVGDFDGFRQRMLGDHGVRELVDFPVASEVFPGVEVKGGICYFIWDGDYNGEAKVTTIRGKEQMTAIRSLDEFDVFVRDPRAVGILHKVLGKREKSITDILTNKEPFKFETNFSGHHQLARSGDLPLYFISGGKRAIAYIEPTKVEKNRHLVATWKLFVPQAYGAGETVPHQIVGKPIVASSPSVCTGSFMFFWVGSEAEALSLQSYYSTKLFRFLVSLRKITQLAQRSVYTWVPQQTWDRTWTDKALYMKYDLSQDQVDYIEAVIKPMNLGTEGDDE